MIKLNTTARVLVAGLLLLLATPAARAGRQDGEQILHDRLNLYRQAFPHIKFVRAQGGDHWEQEYLRIASLLGEKPDALDYEHPPQFTNDLMIVTMERLAMMLRRNEVSETLFRTDKQGALKGSLVCVITLDPKEIIHNDLAATAYMIRLPDSLLVKIHPGRRLNPSDFLLFAIDHEVYHCLESAIIGGAPLTAKAYGGEYNEYRRENSADAFALAMQRRGTEGSTQFAQNIMLVRSLWFLDGGPCYRTDESLKVIRAMPRAELREKTIAALVQLADAVRDREGDNYESFIEHEAIALQAAEQIGFKPSDYGRNWISLAQHKSSAKRVTETAGYYLELYGHLFDDTPIEFRFDKRAH